MFGWWHVLIVFVGGIGLLVAAYWHEVKAIMRSAIDDMERGGRIDAEDARWLRERLRL